ncbi:M23 family metallopeptidase [Streptomyces sp. NBC_00083]|uniref:M23 family metallopeptidase n=1 Tax=Streptomyces sp. NBC_00083 TaxID=2975647 RepID=UPI002256125F|nr:M23 family metallopeptidase [Streptomyces sp. NBC_00083]MCX5385974.1 M23 family metallopeptidase [Streptomyces sp. NBC_00083]
MTALSTTAQYSTDPGQDPPGSRRTGTLFPMYRTLFAALLAAAAWPVLPPVVVHPWAPPATPYGPGHRGVDLAAPAGTPVRAAASGRVTFAGQVAGRGVLTITLPGPASPPLRTTYEPVRPLLPVGTSVTAGQVVATTTDTPSHCPEGCLHWGLLRSHTYLNPLLLLHHAARPRLLPVVGVAEPG